jgi:hypothetical protein
VQPSSTGIFFPYTEVPSNEETNLEKQTHQLEIEIEVILK